MRWSRRAQSVLRCRRGARLSADVIRTAPNSSFTLVLGAARRLEVKACDELISRVVTLAAPVLLCCSERQSWCQQRRRVIRRTPGQPRRAIRHGHRHRHRDGIAARRDSASCAVWGGSIGGVVVEPLASVWRPRSTSRITFGCTRRTGPAHACPRVPALWCYRDAARRG